MSRRVSSPVLVGRERELDLLVAALDRATAGQGGLVLVDGDAGIGKTRLIEDFCALARERGARVLSGGCLPFADSVPYAPMLTLLHQLGPDDDHQLRAAGDPGDRARFYERITARLLATATGDPVVAVVEDLQWADQSTGDLLLYVAQGINSGRVLLVGSRRLDEPATGAGLGSALGELVRSGRAERVRLEPLAPDRIIDLVRGITAVRPAPGLIQRVVARADGNPFFVEELVAAGGGDELPATVRELVLERVGRVQPATQALLRVVSAIGRRAGHRLIRDISGLPPGELDSALRDAISHRLLAVDEDCYVFRHALAREAVYGQLPPGDRRGLHERIARALTDHPELAVGNDRSVAAAELAHHWLAAGRPGETLAASVAAGRAAEIAHAPAEAHTHYRRALDLWPQVSDPGARTGVDHGWLLARAAGAAAFGGRHTEAIRLGEVLLTGLDPDRQPEEYVAALERQAWYLRHAARFDEARDAYATLAGQVPSSASATRARALCGVAGQAYVDGQYRRAAMVAREALVAARTAGARSEEAAAAAVLGAARNLVGCHDEAMPLLEEALALARESGQAGLVADNWHYLLDALVLAGRPGDALPHAVAGAAEMRRLGLIRTWLPKFAAEHTRALLALGRWDEADQVSAAAMSDSNEPFFALRLLLARSLLLIRRGRFGEADRMLAGIERIIGDNRNPWSVGYLACRRAELACWLSDIDAARAAQQRGRQVVEGTDEVGLMLELAALGARIEADAGDAEAADEHVRWAEALYARTTESTGCRSGPFLLQLALIRAERGRLDPQPWADIARAAGDDAYLTAYANWRQATPTALDSARGIATELGAVPLLDRIPDPRAGELDRLGLTSREVEILTLLGQGLSNGRIGAELFISPKTVSVHVTNIVKKVGVGTRVQAAALALRLGLVSPDSKVDRD